LFGFESAGLCKVTENWCGKADCRHIFYYKAEIFFQGEIFYY
jgi:hypothetical protein